MFKNLLYSLLCLITTNFLYNVTYAQGTLDKSFGNNGISITDFNSNIDRASDVAVQNDGRIIVAGYSIDSANKENVSICRYLHNGSLDSSFGNNGKLYIDLLNESTFCSSIAIQQNDKIVIGGGANYGIFLMRINANGTIDSSFGINGVAIYYPTNFDEISKIALQDDGKIVTAGLADSPQYPGGNVFTVHRFNTNGTFDSSFGGSGTRYFDIFSHENSAADDVVIQKTGKIVVGGFMDTAVNHFVNCYIALVRLNIDGSIDSSFGDYGMDTVYIESPYDYGVSMALQNDDKILVSNFTYNQGQNSFALLRFNENGRLDNSFGINGLVKTRLSGESETKVEHDDAYSVCVDKQGFIYQAGVASAGINADYGLVKYKNNGSLDSSFADNGIAITPILNGDDLGMSVKVDQEQNVIVAGYSDNGSNSDFSIARYNNQDVLALNDLELSAVKENTCVLLNWQAESQNKINYFVIQRTNAVNTLNWKDLENIEIGNYLPYSKSFSFNDISPLTGLNYYRLKEIDENGQTTYSNIDMVNFFNSTISFYPNPVKNVININLGNNSLDDKASISIIDMQGKVVANTKANGNLKWDISMLPSGMYYLVLYTGSGKTSFMFSKQ